MRVITIRKDQVDWSVPGQITKTHRKLIFFLGAVLDTLSQIIENAKGFEGAPRNGYFVKCSRRDSNLQALAGTGLCIQPRFSSYPVGRLAASCLC